MQLLDVTTVANKTYSAVGMSKSAQQQLKTDMGFSKGVTNMANIPPCRARYFVNHPVVAIRLPIHLRDELQAYSQAHGMTLNALVTKLFKDQSEPLEGFKEGYYYGLGEAIIKESFNISCSKCKKSLTISRGEMVKVLQTLISNLQQVKCPYCDKERPLEVTIKKQEVAPT